MSSACTGPVFFVPLGQLLSSQGNIKTSGQFSRSIAWKLLMVEWPQLFKMRSACVHMLLRPRGGYATKPLLLIFNKGHKESSHPAACILCGPCLSRLTCLADDTNHLVSVAARAFFPLTALLHLELHLQLWNRPPNTNFAYKPRLVLVS